MDVVMVERIVAFHNHASLSWKFHVIWCEMQQRIRPSPGCILPSRLNPLSCGYPKNLNAISIYGLY